MYKSLLITSISGLSGGVLYHALTHIYKSKFQEKEETNEEKEETNEEKEETKEEIKSNEKNKINYKIIVNPGLFLGLLAGGSYFYGNQLKTKYLK